MPILGLFTILVLLSFWIAPWGNFPLNDDWQYSLIAHLLAVDGKVRLILPVAPSLVLQSYLGSWVIQGFGFNHLYLRLLTLLISAIWLVAIDWILRELQVAPLFRFLAGLLVILNPLFVHVALSFMTEPYGFAFATLGVAFWFYGRRSSHSWIFYNIGAILLGLSFWVRQLCALYFPALIFAEAVLAWQEKQFWKRAVQWVLPSLLFTLLVVGFAVWVRQTKNLTVAFEGNLVALLIPNVGNFILQGFVFLVYGAFFFSPWLVQWKVPFQEKKYRWVLGLLFAIAIGVYIGSTKRYPMKANLHAVFPFLGNVMNPSGLGPITLTDRYTNDYPTQLPHFTPIWILIECLLIIVALNWKRVLPAKKHFDFVSLFALGAIGIQFLIITQAFQQGIIDRYLMGFILPALLLLARISHSLHFSWKKAAFPVIFLALYSWGGEYDYFRWNEVRWQLVSLAQSQSIPMDQLDGGFEVNGSLHFQDIHADPYSDPLCGPQKSWFCGDLKYGIGWEPLSSRVILESRKVNSLWVNYPEIFLYSQR